MQCLHQRLAAGARWRLFAGGTGLAGVAVAAACSVLAHGVERGAAAWLVSLLAAGLLTPFLAAGLRSQWRTAQSARVRLANWSGRPVPAPPK
ncbi:hypothetical protein F2P45_18290 [Massilia sp. CCM 8733]|uniref:Uncharacterized protein n=1 Tax=Massilia mucilaginosa TaxID=2609282 RepID=A0ABX0NVN1_9BURK|nr:hypothetical protein [Massilia mucilaginosa]NHZ90953.1 hypothetical protein [Massilia mucilaginosa]